MTKKDFQLIAEVIKEEVEWWQVHERQLQPPTGVQVLNTLAHTMKARLHHANPQFNEMKFLEACGLG